MTAFDDAARVLHDDPNLAQTAVYRMLGRGPEQTISVIASVPDDLQQVFGQSIRVGTITLAVLAAEVPTVQQGDTFQIGERQIVAIDAKLDVEGVSWTAQCRNA